MIYIREAILTNVSAQPVKTKTAYMKLLFSFFVLLAGAGCNAYAQQNAAATIEYIEINNTDLPNKLTALLYIDGNESVFHEKFSTKTEIDTKPLPEGVFISKGHPADDTYLKTDRAKKQILFFDGIGGNNYLVEDAFGNIKWNITSDTKQLAGYNCVKAIGSYRGREWEAWFAPDIPFPFGPWKLNGLPGLILEARDDTKRFEFVAVKVSFTQAAIVSKDFTTLVRTTNKKPVPYRKFLADREEYSDNAFKEVQQKISGTITRTEVPRSGLELKYEWEQ